ncbi:hypothetical protein GCK72_009840 [Caenorhabditis remanei]|uniref:Uncharacterized protein n=1 Tax=Caenorhabditis remanei TaxID=31234 RepID=A0A6A5H4B3_CAERE|nr:hypothetical protein GCK72_009840 [Caenorhabditis remanei]KAF1761584.1 hypothetical protein GCK72_009840 [Caenorhabditis remanei]
MKDVPTWLSSWSWWSWWSRWTCWLLWLTLTPCWKSRECLTLLTEDRVEWIDTWLGWWSNKHLNIHHFSPCGLSLDTEETNTVKYFIMDLIDGIVEGWNHNEAGGNGQTGKDSGHRD